MSEKAKIIVTIFSIFSGLCSGELHTKDIFSSMSDMENLFEMEPKITEKVENFIQLLDSQIDNLDSFLDKHYKNHNYTEEDAEEYVSYPLNTYSQIKRLAIDWPEVEHTLFGNHTHKHIDDILNLLDDFKIKELDLDGSIHGLLLLINTYQFNLTDFIQGKIQIPKAQYMDLGMTEKYIQDNPLTLSDLHVLGQMSFNNFNLVQSVEILQAAEKRAQEENNMDRLKIIRSNLKSVIRQHDQLFLRQTRDEKYVIGEYPFDKKLIKKMKKKTSKNKKEGKKYPDLQALSNYHLHPDDVNEAETQDLFAALCRGENIRTPKMDIDIKCQYLHYFNPYLRLGPFKMETKNHAPFVAIFRDFMTENEIKSFIKEASPNLSRSMHAKKGNNQKSFGSSSYVRTSKQSWIKEDENPKKYESTDDGTTLKVWLATKVSLRIQNATLMNVFTENGGEAFQVANYGMAGQYSSHYDSAEGLHTPFEYMHMGDRVQTFMAYLSDVEAGGATVFPYLGISVWPKKGDAITWYNVDKNIFRRDYLSLHGSCPIIKGSKWITNKWIRHFAQSFNFPCQKNEEFSRLKPLENDICNVIPSCKPRFRFGYFTK